MGYNLGYKGEEINTLLGKAGTALQSVPDGYATEVYVDNQIKDIKDVTGWKQTEYTRRANGTIITFSPKLQKGQVIVSLEGITSISLYDESGATRSVNVNILPFVVDKTYVSWAAYVANEPNVIMIVESSVISELAKVATSGDYNDLSNKPNLGVYATKTELSDKVDKVSGKQLTTEDFTTALKTKLEGLHNYDDTELENALASLQGQLNTLVSGNASDAINSFNEIIAFLDGVKDSEDLESIIASIEQQIAGKQDKITDLETIRSGAAKGATALQSYTEKYTGTITGITMNGASKGTSGVVDLGTVITSHQDISGKADKSSLAAVATSGSYNDLNDKPTIPTAVTESTVSGWGFTKNTGTYSKPSSGIPKTDLASAVRTSLGKADTAIQSLAGYATEDYVADNYLSSKGGTVTGNLTIGSSSLTTTSYKLHVAGSIRATSGLIIGTKNESGTAPLQVQNSTYDATTSFTGTSLNFRINYPNGGFASTLTWLNNSATYAQLGVFMSQNVFSHLGIGQSIRSTSDCWVYINSAAATFNVAATFKKTIKIGEATLSYENGVLKVDKPFSPAS